MRSISGLRRVGIVAVAALAAALALPVSSASADTPGPIAGYDYSNAIRPLAACEANTLAGNDDGFVIGSVPLGFPINFYGNTYTDAFVNNNGNITFDVASGVYVPFNLLTSVHPIIAAFFTDIDTRGPGRTVKYGAGTTATGEKYFCVDFINVAQYSVNASQGLDDFQLLLFDASTATGGHAGDFDIEFNYDSMPWDHGTARAGFAAGTGVDGTALELPGSGVNGAMVNGGPNALISSSANSATAGRYRYPIRGNGVIPTGSVSGLVSDDDGNPVAGANVQACRPGGFCRTTQTGSNGRYTVNNLTDATWSMTAWPPDNTGTPAHGTGIVAGPSHAATVDMVLTVPHVVPPGVAIGSTNGTTTVGGVQVPVIYWGQPHPMTFTGCAGASPAQVRLDGFTTGGIPYTNTLTAVESPTTPGTYTATIPEFASLGVHGDMLITILLTCPGSGTPTGPSFTIYIDPSGTILSGGAALQGATVTLLTSDSEAGPFTAVPDGSVLMSPANRTNPQTTGADGRYGWDVSAGFYKVRAAKAGCTGPGGAAFVESDVLSIPPAVTGLDLTLDCGTVAPPTIRCPATVTTTVGTALAGVLGTPTTTGSPTVTNNAPTGALPGLNRVTWTAHNAAGTARCTQKVNGRWLFTGITVTPYQAGATQISVNYTLRTADGSTVPVARTLGGFSYTPGPVSPPVTGAYNAATGLITITMTVPSTFTNASHVVTVLLTDNTKHSVSLPAIVANT